MAVTESIARERSRTRIGEAVSPGDETTTAKF
jgi:hypothetical protein